MSKFKDPKVPVDYVKMPPQEPLEAFDYGIAVVVVVVLIFLVLDQFLVLGLSGTVE